MLPALALGAAVLLAEGRIRGYSGFTDSLQGRERSDAYEPDPERAAFYDGLYRRYLDIYPAVKRYYHVQ
jgi:xylulokinase